MSTLLPYTKIEAITEIPELQPMSDLSKPPKQMFYSGTWNPSLFTQCVAVVGSRRITSYGKQVLDLMIPQLVNEGKTIVSGFMYGVDQYAHKLAIDNGGKTIAILGWGITEFLHGEDKKLAQQIIDTGGLLLSEWEQQKATLWTFPTRNRIIVALSHEVIVVEAAAKSGSLITAKLATKLNRPLWAVPGPITSKMSEGTNDLIAQGVAIMWRSGSIQLSMNVISNPILQSISDEARTASEIARLLNKPVAEIGAELTMLALSGQVIERDSKYSLQ